MNRALLVILLLIEFSVVGCGSHPAAPVVDRSSTLVLERSRNSGEVARSGYHIVRKGDTLYRIAQLYGVTVGDISSWNSLSDETKLDVGRELRVSGPHEDVEVKPVVVPDGAFMIRDNATATIQPTPSVSPTISGATVESATILREPKGGTTPYSEGGFAQGHADAAKSAATSQSESRQVSNSTIATTNSIAGIDWSWPVAGKVIRSFGSDKGEINRGIDLAGGRGEAIRAAASGKVSFVGTLKDYGKFVVIRHDADFLSVYGNTSKVLVKEGQSISRGQEIAEIGSSGSEQEKLHFEIRRKSEPVNPLDFLPHR